ncbi:FG-GAP-like repeat-containing protein [Dyadobacter sp. 676]|uniref:FG-GAP-like repeat-containing protein n=1 Tax=Dyadobacter sp. 676 TaxID=3088362 RepID=A0AAU8FCS4_9BACT
MKNRYMPILYVGMVLAAFAAIFYLFDRISRSLPRNPLKTRPASALSAGMPEAALPGTTLSDIRKSLEKQEYHISYDEQKKKLQSPNRRNNIRAYYEPGKLTVQTRVDTTGDGFKMELVNEGVFADGKLLYAPEITAKADHHENKVQISHSAFTEEFINNEDGVRQNFIVQTAPEGTRQLQVKMTAKGLKVEQGSGNELRFYSQTSDGKTCNELVYSDLKCWDADKKPLNATLAYVNNRIQISVDVANAVYPVTIDPIIANGTPQNANKVLEINQSYMWLGFSVASAGDVNGDGYSDVIVGAPQYDKGQDNEGAAFVYIGGPSGLTLTAYTLECNQANAQMGYSVASAGDFNGDGYSDVLVGIPYYDNNFQNEGMANLYFGSAQGIPDNSVPMSFATHNAEDLFGVALATAGDIDADGYSDIIIGAHQADYHRGIVLVIQGAGTNIKGIVTLHPGFADARFGYSVAPAGDVDADGYSDIIVGARYYTNGQGQDAEGAAFIYRGSANGLLSNPLIIEGNQYDAGLGNNVSSAGDVNGDGYSDVLIAAYVYDGPNLKDQGKVSLHLGSSTGINPQPARVFEGGHVNDRMGSSIACAGDVNGDGYSDILIGAQYYDNGQFNEGSVFVYHGSKDGIVGSPVSTLESNQADGWFGTAVASAGDVNGDGYSDILIGCYTFDNGQKDEGHVFVYHGGPEGIGTNETVTLTASAAGALGSSVASAGDVNSDGYDDIIVGAPTFDVNGTVGGIAVLYYGSLNGIESSNQLVLSKNLADSYFGCSVAGAGDVNGDGYGDVVVGAKYYSNGQDDEGAIYIYHGSSGGLGPQEVIHFERGIANSYFGHAVAGAGDINRDGYADIVVGAPGSPNAAYVYQGSAAGITGNPKVLQSGQNGSNFGKSVAAAGDVNGDGYGDVIVGDDWYGQEDAGAAFVYHGSNSGIVVNPAATLLCDQQGAIMGRSVAGAGDVNGDGYSDIIVGAPNYNNGQEYEGVVLAYYGSSTGISNTSPLLLEMNKDYDHFGEAVSGAGDVNGDGYSDIIIGAPYFSEGELAEGAAYVFHGSPTGLKTSPAFQLENGNIDNAYIGFDVAGAGDVNGDGYSDIIAGGPYAFGVGAAVVCYGNNGKGLRNNVRLFNDDLLSPISQSQFAKTNFGLGLFAKSFIGKNKGRLVWETVSNGTPFSKSGTQPITTSTQSTGQSGLITLAATGTQNIAAVSKAAGVATRVRARVRYSPVLAITGQMYGPWRYLQSQLAGYNNAPVPQEAMAETIRRKARPETETSVSLFPNPASDRLSIQVTDPSDIRTVRLYNTSGTPVFQSQRYEHDIDVSKLPGGIYILMLNRANGTTASHRILIRR